jgi:hypothetical protein
MRKKLTSVLAIGALILFSSNSHSAIIYTNITDTPLPTDGSNFDINMDNAGAAEFSFSDMMGPYITFETNNHIATVSDINTGEGWDVVKGFSLGTAINGNSGYYDQGDGFIAPDFATAYYTFPTNVDTYLACQFKIGASTYFGWIRVFWNGTTLTFKDYAYQNSANTSINAGETLTSGGTNGIASIVKNELKVYPNPVQNELTIQTNENNQLSNVSIFSTDGQLIQELSFSNSNETIDISSLLKGSYFIQIQTENNQKQIQKIIKL